MILKDFPEASLADQYKTYNNVIIACIAILIPFRLLSMLGFGFGVKGTLLAMAFSLVIPVALIWYLTSFRASAYLVTIILSINGLAKSIPGSLEAFKSADMILSSVLVFNLLLMAIVIFMSIFVWKKVHPNYKLFSKKA